MTRYSTHFIVPCIRFRTWLAVSGLLLSSLLSGCAAQRAFTEAENLNANGKVEASLAKLKEAMNLEPDNVEFKVAYSRNRERSISNLLAQAQQKLDAGQPAEADSIFDRVLSLEPANERARTGKQLLESKKRPIESPKVVSSVPALQALQAETNKVAVSIDFKDATLKQVFEVIAQSSGLNILFDKDVKLDQKTFLILKNSTTEAAIYYLLLTNNLEQQVMDSNTLLIYPNSADKQKTYQQIIVKTFLLSNAKASIIAESLKNLLKLHDVVVDEKLNMLIVRDTAEALLLAEKLIANQDIAEPEVMLEVEVLEVSRERLLELGIAWPGNLTLSPLKMTTALDANQNPVTSLAKAGDTFTLTDLKNTTQDTLGAAIAAPQINARALNTDANILANPRIRVLNHEKAKIIVGDKVPSISATTVASTTPTTTESITYLDVGLKLEVEPTIYLNNDVAIRVGLEVSNIVNTQKSTAGTVYYTIGTRAANTMLRLKDGETQVLAGLINDDDQRTANQLPGLGDIPILGHLFGSKLHDGKKTEIVLSITPHLIRNIKRPDAGVSEFLSGTENSMRRRPDFSVRTVTIAPPATTSDTTELKGEVLQTSPITK